jgi:hypothetical protein
MALAKTEKLYDDIKINILKNLWNRKRNKKKISLWVSWKHLALKQGKKLPQSSKRTKKKLLIK